jgi:hypothetical protein
LAVIDLDGVVADTRHRMHFIAKRRNWDAFFAAAVDDPPHPEGLAAARTAVEAGLTVLYLSGRPERYRRDTERWLREHDAPAGEVILRPAGDHRSADRLKVALLRNLARRYDLRLLVDDDPRVIAAVKAASPPLVDTVLQADWQPYTRAAEDRRRD